MKLLFRNAKILTSARASVSEGEVHVSDGKIVYVGKPKEFAAERVVDCGGNLLIPGFANAHTHSAMVLFRGLADDLPLHEWLHDRIFPLEEHLTEDDVYWGTMLAAAEYVRGGTTAIADMYYGEDAIISAVQQSGLAMGMWCGAADLSGGTEDALKHAEEYYLKFRENERIRYLLGVHSEYLASDALLYGMADLAQTYGAPATAHVSETLKETGECTVRRNLTPVQFLCKIGFFDFGGVIAHGTYLEKEDVRLLAEKEVFCASNPSSNLKLASGIAPVYSMLQNGMKVCLGTDGAASNNALSMFREMYLLSCLQKGVMKDAAAVSAEQAFAAATESGYRALGLPGGTIERGNPADMVLLDLSAPNFRPENNLKKHIVYSADNANVLMTVANGKIVYDRGNYDIGEDIDAIYRNAERCIGRLKSKAGL